MIDVKYCIKKSILVVCYCYRIAARILVIFFTFRIYTSRYDTLLY